MTIEPKHVVVVLSWNGRADTLACVDSLRTGSPDVDVLVVDNGSVDGTLDEIALRWPSISTIQSGSNLGFAGGMNVGIRHALETGADYVTVLNNDTVIPAGSMAVLRSAAGPDLAVSP